MNDNIIHLLQKAENENMAIKITYEDSKKAITRRILSEVEFCRYNTKYGYKDNYIKAYCHARNENRIFNIHRIQNIEILDSIPKKIYNRNVNKKELLDKINNAMNDRNEIKIQYIGEEGSVVEIVFMDFESIYQNSKFYIVEYNNEGKENKNIPLDLIENIDIIEN